MSNNYPYKNDITVEVDGKAHNSWKSYDIDSDFLIPADAFKFDLGVPSNSTVLPDFSGAEVKVRINGELVMTGIVDTTQHTISKTNRTYSLNGRDRASILVDCSAPITNVKGLTVLDAVKKIVEPNGELIVGGADYSTPPVATLCCMKDGKRNNFEQADLTFDVSNRFSEVTFLAQSHGKQGQDNKNDLKWVYNDPEMTTYKPKTVVVSDVDNLEALQKWAKKYIADSVLEGFTLTIVVPDHKMQDGTLWQPGQRVHVICEEYEIDAIFFLMGRRFTLSRNGGTQTELRFKQDGIWTPDAYSAKAEKARKRKGKKGKKNQGDLISTNGQGGWTK